VRNAEIGRRANGKRWIGVHERSKMRLRKINSLLRYKVIEVALKTGHGRQLISESNKRRNRDIYQGHIILEHKG